ncbi:MAG TPA: hypothetical protein VET65_08995 [Candidatus Limnocylindrales bacterium]|nr:hypothetical protein [Candidatus Limnocylindrales bacterium]
MKGRPDVAALLATMILTAGCGALRAPVAQVSGLPLVSPEPIMATSAGAQVAWLWLQAQDGSPYLVAYDPGGRQVARVGAPPPSGTPGAVYGFWRSPDGASIFVTGASTLIQLAATDGHPVRTYPLPPPAPLMGDAFSPDGRYLAWLTSRATDQRLDVLDLRSGTWLPSAAIPHDSQAQTPGASTPASWGVPVFADDSTHVYTVTDWGGPTRISAFTVDRSGVLPLGSRVLPNFTCSGPAMAVKVIDGGATLAAFCHFDGTVPLIDLKTLRVAALLRPRQSNPFWGSPIFTRDGRLLYVLEPGTGQVVDLEQRVIRGPFRVPTAIGDPGPLAAALSLLTQPAEAGWVATTVPLSPDGLTLYVAEPDGVMALHVPDLTPMRKLAAGSSTSEVWVSGDGTTLYVTSGDGKTLISMRADGTQVHRIDLPALAGGFIAAEHG